MRCLFVCVCFFLIFFIFVRRAAGRLVIFSPLERTFEDAMSIPWVRWYEQKIRASYAAFKRARIWQR